MKRALSVGLQTLALLAASLWLGGIVVLGAVVAPAVFRIVHAPDSADSMTVVFLTFDKVAMSAAVVVLVTEVARSRLSPVRRVDVARLLAAAVASALAFLQGMWLSPQIADLHAQGAIRNSGDLGRELERVHRASELCGKTESLLLVAFFVLSAVSMAPARRVSPAEPDRT